MQPSPLWMTVHPRVCGELARLAVNRAHDGRFIPACAGNSGRAQPPCHSAAVHPRVCGELGVMSRARPGCDGSSPRVRGTRDVRPLGRVLRRFIPACAGNSRQSRRRVPASGGSSPRVRGTPDPLAKRRRRPRFIPACAGNSAKPGARVRNAPVHPRVCGELGVVQRAPLLLAGSSPRVRGTRRIGQRRPGGRRFIPACAGNSCRFRRLAVASKVHPRVCGELALARAAGAANGGSSPRVRGTLLGRRRQCRRPRFIPACAGNSADWRLTGISPTGSSPRVRGTPAGERPPHKGGRFIPACAGNSMGIRVLPFDFFGSSPRVRGTLRALRVRKRRRRFIPACAGNSGLAVSHGRTHPVHPRVCGELLLTSTDAVNDHGSSPRVRGTQRSASVLRMTLRFIPACAGNSPAML